MKSLWHGRMAGMIALLVSAAITLVACMPDATSEIISPELGPRLIASAVTYETVEAEPTPVPLQLADLSDEEVVAGLDDELVAALASADPSNGETLSLTNACIGCHAVDPSVQGTGPTWHNIGNTAVNRVDGMSPGLYLYNSIAVPNEYIVEGYDGGLMPQNYQDLIGTEDFADILAYLLEQDEE